MMSIARSCLDACKERGYDDAIEYGISVQYARTRQWGIWEVFREFVQNALDEEHYNTQRIPDMYPCREEHGNTVIFDRGRGISVDNLLLGESKKEPWQRGRFGEGMKLALLGALVLGHRVTIRSRDKLIEPITIQRIYEDRPVEVLCTCIKKGLPPITGTEVTIHNLNLCGQYEDHVVQGLMPTCILIRFVDQTEHPHEWRDVIDKSCTYGTGWIYLRDLFVTKVSDFFRDINDSIYSYNLYNVQIDESRKIPSASSVYNEIEQVLRSIISTAPNNTVARKILSEIIMLVLTTPEGVKPYLEATVYISPMQISEDARRVVSEVFDEIFGKESVVVDSISGYEYARYLGLKTIFCTEHLCQFISKAINTYKRIADKQIGYLHQVVDVQKFDPDFYEVIKALEDLADVIFKHREYGYKILYAILDPDKAGQSMKDGGKTVIVNLTLLLDICESHLSYCIEHYLGLIAHEIAHIRCNMCADTSEDYPVFLTEVTGEALNRTVYFHSEVGTALERLYEAYNNWKKKSKGGS